MSRTNSASSYLSDDDLLLPAEIPRSESKDCIAPSYHFGEDAYKQRKAMQEVLRKQAGAQCVIAGEVKKEEK